MIQSGKGGVGVDGDSIARRDGSKLNENEIDSVEVDSVEVDGVEIDGIEVDGGEVGDDEGGKKVQKTFKSKNVFKSIKLSKSKEMV